MDGWDQLILWKKDLKGAFNPLNYNPAFCKLFAFPLSDGATIIHMAGLFGWIGMPHFFLVLTRSLQALCSHIIIGLCYWYVDDLMAVSPISSYLTDSTHVDNSVQHLLGEGSISRSKNPSALDNSNFWVGPSIWIRRQLHYAREICTNFFTPCFASIQAKRYQ
jgi:hypothetical protein